MNVETNLDRQIQATIEQSLELNKKFKVLNQEDEKMAKENQEVKKDLATLKTVARTEPNVFFTAGISENKWINKGATVIYDQVYVNQGAGYDKNIGIFRAPVSGFL